MNHNDRSCYWGHYFLTMPEAYQCLFDKAVKSKLIEMEKYDCIETNCLQWLEKEKCWDQCNVTDKPDLYSTYGHLKTGGVSCFSDHYSAIDCITWANWIVQKYNMEIYNAMDGNLSEQLSIDNIKE